ncbi:BspA family leucine-rich repeat surface protein [Carboxylicivirga caseinilyticus]|uniref:BspA family leucine-rich repeat surface protein n=1 Tax=Carboxylicivirga caseinilyticus TaxID=3417572 RepID=UPI003D335122|nr:BspA family leucine-rich repeat surface protein [Marinilabiliaceae bacterium A049]
MLCKKIYFAFATAFTLVVNTMGQQLHVPVNYSSIQTAINAATEGDTVLVAEGTYYENINFNGKPITVASQFILDGDTSHISKTIIDGSQPANTTKASVVTITNIPNGKATLTGLTITGGSGSYVYFVNAGRYMGGGIYINGNGAIISNNHIQKNILSRNVNLHAAGVAAILSENDTLIVENNLIEKNEIISDKMCGGGGLWIFSGRNSFIRVHDNTVQFNKVTSSADYKVTAGGIAVNTEYAYEADVQIYNNIVSNNELHCLSSIGAGIYVTYNRFDVTPLTSTQVRIFNNIISNNYSQDKGGGIGVWNLAYDMVSNSLNYPADPVIVNNTLYGNEATEGSGVFNYDAKTVMINNILWDNIPSLSGMEIFQDSIDDYNFPNGPYWPIRKNFGTLHLNNNCIKGGWQPGQENVWEGTWIGENNIDSDPILNTETFELSEDSKCIGAGVDSIQIDDAWYKAPPYDFNDSIRPHPVDKFMDIGAIESPYANTPYFYLDENGVTIKCLRCQPGDKGIVGEKEYEAVDRALLEQRRDEDADLTILCTSLVTDMGSLFYRMSEFNQDISSWDVSKVINMWGIFSDARSFNQDISYWDVSNVSNMTSMFSSATSFDQDISGWNVSHVTDMGGMFSNAENFNQNIGSWKVSNVTDMGRMFNAAASFNQPISDWDVSNVTDMKAMFSGYYIPDQPWPVVVNMKFNQDIGDWDVGKVTDMYSMFSWAKDFNQDIGDWDVSQVTYMGQMFNKAESFNQDLSNWCVQNITSEPDNFATDCPLQTEYYPIWGSCPPATIIINNNETKDKIAVSPNPIKSTALIETVADKPIQRFELIDLTGKVVRNYSNINSHKTEINCSQLNSGLYLLKVYADKVYIRKVMIE